MSVEKVKNNGKSSQMSQLSSRKCINGVHSTPRVHSTIPVHSTLQSTQLSSPLNSESPHNSPVHSTLIAKMHELLLNENWLGHFVMS